MDNLILVIYVGVQGVRMEDIEYFVKNIQERIAPSTMEGEIIVIPTQSPDTRIECINPKYITDKELINEHTSMMKNLRLELINQMEELKTKRNE